MKYCVYITTNLKTGAKYVGASTTDRVLDGYIGSGTLLGKAIREHGKEAFEAEVVSKHGTRLSAFKAEAALIKKMCETDALYNSQSNPYQRLNPHQKLNPTRKPKSVHLSMRVDEELWELIGDLALERGHTKTQVIVDFIMRGINKLEEAKAAEVAQDKATREVELNAAFNSRQFEELTKEEKRNQQDAFHLSQGHITFNEIIEKHKVELEKKYK